MKRIYILLLAVIAIFSGTAQNKKARVAIFDPTTVEAQIDGGTVTAIREIMSSTIVNSSMYNIVERSLLDNVMKEQKFSNSGAVDESQATEIGKLAGANKVIVSVITKVKGRNLLSIKMIDVKTANVERQKIKMISEADLLDVIEPMVLSLIEQEVEVPPTFNSETPVSVGDELVFYLPPGFQGKSNPKFEIIFDKKQVGTGTVQGGFLVRAPKPAAGIYELRIGSLRFKINTEKYNYFEFGIAEGFMDSYKITLDYKRKM